MATYAQQLAEVQEAISAILTRGQSYEIASNSAGGGSSRRLVRADLPALLEREKRLIPLAAQETSGRSGRRSTTYATGF